MYEFCVRDKQEVPGFTQLKLLHLYRSNPSPSLPLSFLGTQSEERHRRTSKDQEWSQWSERRDYVVSHTHSLVHDVAPKDTSLGSGRWRSTPKPFEWTVEVRRERSRRHTPNVVKQIHTLIGTDRGWIVCRLVGPKNWERRVGQELGKKSEGRVGFPFS